jgi:hypothetical protein
MIDYDPKLTEKRHPLEKEAVYEGMYNKPLPVIHFKNRTNFSLNVIELTAMALVFLLGYLIFNLHPKTPPNHKGVVASTFEVPECAPEGELTRICSVNGAPVNMSDFKIVEDVDGMIKLVKGQSSLLIDKKLCLEVKSFEEALNTPQAQGISLPMTRAR